MAAVQRRVPELITLLAVAACASAYATNCEGFPSLRALRFVAKTAIVCWAAIVGLKWLRERPRYASASHLAACAILVATTASAMYGLISAAHASLVRRRFPEYVRHFSLSALNGGKLILVGMAALILLDGSFSIRTRLRSTHLVGASIVVCVYAAFLRGVADGFDGMFVAW
eukprot:CAMPEP_0206046060 /NCGR_PEP_ID=MMETSP1466-20131121/17628_1 /ASSEMBLY_ACC=CAM_ASM_001126 /TAXON_ID=44452 /ORGANISM="Pavlova gyrans, Strain CCMP608" /LENGTH=170 /DNA_ID=CAMNT_0053421027 /DNA_START=31 /DNA_END=543 /DNA_ORIENTATION=+